MATIPLTLALRRQRQVNVYEFKTRLVYIILFRLMRSTQ